MADDRLRLVVDMQNKASAELKNLRRDMGAVKTTPGMLSAKTWFSELSSVSSATTKAVNPLISGLNTMGVSGLAAGLSIAGLVSQFRDLGKSLPALQELSRQTGMSRTEIERLKQTASNLNVDPSKMTAGLQAFSREMVGFHNRSSELYHRMVNEGAGGLAEKIRKEDPSAAFRDMLRYMDAIPASAQRAGRSAADAVQIQRHFVGEAFGDEDFAQILGKGMTGFESAYADAAKDVGVITDAMVKAAADFDRSISRFDASWDALKRDLGTTVLPGLTAATDGMRALFDELKHDPELIGIGAASLGALYARARILKAASGGGAGGGIAPATAAKIEGAAVEQVKAGATFAEAVAEFRLGVREMAARGAVPGGGGGPVPGEPIKPGASEVVKEAPKGFLGGGGFKGLASGLAEGVVGGIVYDYGEKAMDALLGWTAGNQKTLDHATSLGTVYKDVKDQWFGGSPSHPDDDREARLRRTERQRLMREPLEGGLDRMRTEMTGQRQGVPTAFQPIPSHPDDDRLSRARAADAPDRTLDGVVVGALGKEIIHLTGTLRTASTVFSGDGVRPAAFHPASLGAALAAGGPADTIAAAVKEGTLSAFREWAGTQDLDGKGGGPGGGGGFTPAAFHPGGGYGGGGGGFGGGAPGSYHGGGDGGEFKAGTGKQSMLAKESYDFWKSKGLDHAHAIGMMVQEQAENNFSNTPGDYVRGRPTAFSPFQFHMDRARLIKAGTGIDVTDANLAHADALRAAYYDATQGGRKGFLGRYQRESSGLDGTSDYATKFYEGPKELAKDQVTRRRYAHMWDTRGFPSGVSDAAAGRIPGQVRGNLKIGDETYAYGSGGVRGAAHVPFGDYPIRPDSGNPWGQAHNAMDVNGNGSMWDAALGRMRTGIEMHVAHSASMVTEGCLSFLKDQYPQLKARVKDMVAKTGHAYLHVDENGASITPFAKVQAERPRPEIAPMPAITPEPSRADAQTSRRDDDPANVHVHLHQDGRVRAIRSNSSAGVQLTLHSGRTMTQFA